LRILNAKNELVRKGIIKTMAESLISEMNCPASVNRAEMNAEANNGVTSF
jgi:hypothetical protein